MQLQLLFLVEVVGLEGEKNTIYLHVGVVLGPCRIGRVWDGFALPLRHERREERAQSAGGISAVKSVKAGPCSAHLGAALCEQPRAPCNCESALAGLCRAPGQRSALPGVLLLPDVGLPWATAALRKAALGPTPGQSAQGRVRLALEILF